MFIASVVEFGLILRDSKYKGTADIKLLKARITDLDVVKDDVYKQDFLELIDIYLNYYLT